MVHRAGEAADPEEERATHESPQPYGISGWLERVCRLHSVLATSPAMAAEDGALRIGYLRMGGGSRGGIILRRCRL